MKYIFYPVLLAMALLMSCLDNENLNCGTESVLEQQEFYLKSNQEGYYLTQFKGDELVFSICNDVLPADSIGVEGIYAVNGALVESCETGACISVDEYLDPYCIVDYSRETGDFTLQGIWQLANLRNQNTTLHPSCLFNEIVWTIENTVEGEGSLTASGLMGVNTIEVSFSLLDNSQLLKTDVISGTQASVPYVAYFEEKVIEFFETSDDFVYAIVDNILTIQAASSDVELTFYLVNQEP